MLLLLDLAQQFEQTGARGLHRFLLWMQRQETEGVEPAAPGGESRSVRILSIHKSKGLEFPFVFLCDTARLFNKSDARTSVLVHPALGLGPKCTDLEHGVEYPTIARQAIAAQLLTETLSEEMRLLYVAMTRAKERLVITGTVRDIGKTVSNLTATATVPLAPELLRAAQSPLHWLLQSALLDRDEHFLRRNYVYLKADAAAERTEAEAEPTLPEPDPTLLAQLGRALTFRYGHAQAIDLPSKVTATELKRLEAEDTPPEDTGAPLLAGVPRTQTFRRPDFSARARKLTAAERGTATHRILQYLHFADARTPEGIRAQVETLTARGELTGARRRPWTRPRSCGWGKRRSARSSRRRRLPARCGGSFASRSCARRRRSSPAPGTSRCCCRAWWTRGSKQRMASSSWTIRPTASAPRACRRARRTMPRSCALTPGPWRASPGGRSAAACCISCTAAGSATCRARTRKKMRKPLAILSPVC